MDGYAWPADAQKLAQRARQQWVATVAALPLGSHITGEVIARQRFGVFLRIDGVPDAVRLAEITALPQDAELPAVATTVTGEVTDHAEHNHQVKIRLTQR